MEAVREKLTPLAEKGHFTKTIDDVQDAIDALIRAKGKIQNGTRKIRPNLVVLH